MIILGIETSCDETAAAVVEETGDPERPWRLRSSVVASQVEIHREWGGVVPELSARQHIRDICGVVERALADAGVADAYDAIAVTQGPGLVGSLLVGLSFAKSLAWARGVPLIPVHHLAGHIESLVLEGGEMPLPAIVLVVSGGHTSLYRVAAPGVLRAARPHARRCGGRGVRQGREAARTRISGRAGRSIGWPRAATIARSPFPKTRLTHADRNAPHLPGRARFQLQRPEDVGAAPRDRAPRGARPGVHASRCPNARSPTSAPAFSASSSRRCSIGCSTRRAGTARAASASPAASRPTAGCARTRERAGPRAGFRCSSRRLALSTDNAAMIAAAGLRTVSRRGLDRPLDVNADASLALE